MRVSTCRIVLSRAIVIAWPAPSPFRNSWTQCSARFLHSSAASCCRPRSVQVAAPHCLASHGVSSCSNPSRGLTGRCRSRAPSPSHQRHVATAVQELAGSAAEQSVRPKPHAYPMLKLCRTFGWVAAPLAPLECCCDGRMHR